MSKVLYVTANPKNEADSFSLSVGRQFISAYLENHTDDVVTTINVYHADIPLIDGDVLSGWEKLQRGKGFSELTPAEQAKTGRIDQLTAQFLDHDKYVFVTPLWNLGLPPMLKAYVDTFIITGKTFRYTETGPVGLLKNKKALHIQASGGLYSAGDFKYKEFGNSYLKTILEFIGIQDIRSVLIEGMAYMPNEAQNIKSLAIKQAIGIAKEF